VFGGEKEVAVASDPRRVKLWIDAENTEEERRGPGEDGLRR